VTAPAPPRAVASQRAGRAPGVPPFRKTALPARPRGLIRRERLSHLLGATPPGSVALVSAAAGWGKTVVVSEWARATDQPVAWVSCDEARGGPVEFWSHVREALAAVTGAKRAPSAPGPVGISSSGTRMRATLEPLQHVDARVALVLDDFHLVGDAQVLADLEHLVTHLPANLLLVISTRSDPLIPLYRARISSRIREIRARDLAFTSYETTRLLEANDITLSNRDVGRLWQRMEGWATGLRLSMMSLSQAADSTAVVDALIRSRTSVAGYLVEQVLSRLAPEDRSFLLDLSVVERFDDDLAEALTGRPDSALRLEKLLAVAGGFVTGDSEQRFPYRFHALFRSLLLSELRFAGPEHARALSLRAAEWYRAANLIHPALDCALAAQAWDLAADLLVDVASVGLAKGDISSIARQLEKFSSAWESQDPRVLLADVLVSLTRGDIDGGEAMLGQCRESLAELPGVAAARGERLLRLLTAGIGFFRGDGAAVLDALGSYDDFIAVGDPPGRPNLGDVARRAVATSLAGYGQLYLGRLNAAEESTRSSLQLAAEDMDWVDLHGRQALAAIALARGEIGSALTTTGNALAVAEDPLADTAFDCSLLHAIRSWAWLEQGDLTRAESSLVQAEAAGPVLHHTPVTGSLVDAVRARFDDAAGADPTTVLAALQEIADLRPRLSPSYLFRMVRMQATVSALLRMGRHDDALAAIAGFRDPRDETNARLARALVLARAVIYEPKSFSGELVDMISETVSEIVNRPVDDEFNAGWRVRLLLAAAVMESRRPTPNRSSQLLQVALDATAADGWRMPYAELGSEIAPLLVQARGRINQHSELVNDLIHYLGGAPVRRAPELVVALSDREAEVLQLLPTGLTQDELADALFISKNTLKTHLGAIYRKLGAASRRQAVIRAEALRLL
jgi:LuxR family maltose regulon positive regulatory protein